MKLKLIEHASPWAEAALTRNQKREGATSWLSLLAAIGVLWWTLWPTLAAPFGMADDHVIIDLTEPTGRLAWTGVPEAISNQTAEPVGRFRPLYWVGQSLEAAIHGRKAELWYIDRLFLAAVMLVCVYFVVSQLIHPILSALVSLLPFSGPQIEVWTRLGPNEAYAMPLTAGGLALILVPALRGRTSPAQAWPGYLLLSLAALAKENFVTLGPIVCLVMLVLTWPNVSRRDWVVAGFVAGFAAADLAAVMFKVREYGTLYPQKHTLGGMSDYLIYLGRILDLRGGFLIALVATLILVLVVRPTPIRGVTLAIAGSALVVASQTYLIGGTFLAGRYLYPAILVIVGVWAFACRLAKWSPIPRVASAILAVLLMIPLGGGIAYGRSLARYNVRTAAEFQASVHRIELEANRVHTRTVVEEPSNAYWDYEPTLSYAAYLVADGYRVETLPLPASSRAGLSPYLARLAGDIDNWSQGGTGDIQPYSGHVHPCVSLVWGSRARGCAFSVGGYDGRAP